MGRWRRALGDSEAGDEVKVASTLLYIGIRRYEPQNMVPTLYWRYTIVFRPERLEPRQAKIWPQVPQVIQWHSVSRTSVVWSISPHAHRVKTTDTRDVAPPMMRSREASHEPGSLYPLSLSQNTLDLSLSRTKSQHHSKRRWVLCFGG